MSDLISREQTIQAIDDYTKGKPLYEYPWQIIEVIKNIPSAEKTGKWIDGEKEEGACGIIYTEQICSVCGFSHSYPLKYRYCPFCGALMRGEEDADKITKDPKGSAFYLKGYYDAKLDYEAKQPSAEKTGKWLHTDVVHIVTNLIEGDAPQSLTCSRCGFKHKFADEYGYSCIWHYCPNCGARMVEE